jgi:ElaB/YqjD/DUF883 family membrane-anchored ribosome-binding protein
MRDEAGNEGTMIDDAKEKIQELASQAHETAAEQVETRLASGMKGAAGTLTSVVQSLRTSGQQLSDQNQGGASKYAHRAADKLEQVSGFLEHADAREVVDRVEDFARREPAMFIGGAIAIGFLGARFLRSSRRDQSQRSGSSARFTSNAQSSYGDSGQRARNTSATQFDRDVTSPSQNDWSLRGDGEASRESAASFGDGDGSIDDTSRFGTGSSRF